MVETENLRRFIVSNNNLQVLVGRILSLIGYINAIFYNKLDNINT